MSVEFIANLAKPVSGKNQKKINSNLPIAVMTRFSTTLIFFVGAYLILLSGQCVLGQDASKDVIKWKIALDIDLSADSTALAYESYFVTFGQSKVEWITQRTDETQQVSTVTNTLAIVNVIKSWRNINEDGEVKFNVTMNKSAGTLTIKRTNGKYNIALNLSGKTGGKLNKVFKIVNVAKQ